jgi:hypothetical protein
MQGCLCYLMCCIICQQVWVSVLGAGSGLDKKRGRVESLVVVAVVVAAVTHYLHVVSTAGCLCLWLCQLCQWRRMSCELPTGLSCRQESPPP